MRKTEKRRVWPVFWITSWLLLFMSGQKIYYGEQAEDILDSTIEEISSEDIEEETVLPTELDLGDYVETMTVGEKQLLYVTVLPETVTEKNITYTSDNSAVAAINGMGRITALSAGTATITVQCGTVTERFVLTVKEPEEQTEHETKIPVTAIEVADYEKELEVDKTMTLSVTVLPSTATDTTVSYSSSDINIATISSTGEIKGIAPGQVTITLTADGISKDISLRVKVKTEAIQVNSTYVILKKGESFLLNTKVVPDNADQSISYKSANTDVATVSDTGEIFANSTGSTTIIVSGKDMSNAVTVIVNEEENTNSSENISPTEGGEKISETAKVILEILSKQDTALIRASDYEVIDRDILKELYDSKKSLIIEDDTYIITLSGKDIVNYQNELYLPMKIEETEKDMEVVLNNGKNLPGKIKLSIKDSDKYKYMYLYNETEEKYEQIDVHNMESIYIDIAGKYKLTTEIIRNIPISLIAAGTGGAIVVVLAVIYTIMKKKYWFW